jgi:hypothetical protein
LGAYAMTFEFDFLGSFQKIKFKNNIFIKRNNMLEKCSELMFKIQEFISFLATTNVDLKQELTIKIVQYSEDLELSLESFMAKDAIKSKTIQQATKKYAEKYYFARAYEILRPIYLLANSKPEIFTPEIIKEIYFLKSELQSKVAVSFDSQEGFKNPYPTCLFFSQAKHAGNFSSKSCREGVSGRPLDDVVQRLQMGEIKPDYLRVLMYLAPFQGRLQPFVYNNRTWVVFSRSKLDANRIVPLVPTQDLLNRIQKLIDIGHNPNLISNEDSKVLEMTSSMRPGP